MNVKTWLENNGDSNLTIEEIDRNIKSLEEKYGVKIPNDLKEFWSSLNGYVFQGCDMIASLTETEEIGISNVAEETDTFKEYIEDWEIDYEIPNFIVIATIYEHGYVIYLNNIKKYVLIEDLFDDYILDGNDEKLLQFNSIYEVFVYFDYKVGDKIFEKEYKKLFPEEVKKEEEFNQKRAKMHLDKINELEEKVKSNEAISFSIILDVNYLETIKKEYQEMTHSCAFEDYTINKEVKIYINLTTKELGLAHNNKIQTHNPYGLFDTPPIITEIIHKDNYFVLKTDRNHLEPIIIFDNYLNKYQIKKLKRLLKKSIFNIFKF